MRRLKLPILSATAAMMLGSGPISASTEIFDDTTSNCAGANCSSLRLPGTVLGFGPSASAWVANVFASPGNCVRLEVISQGADLETTVVAPNGTVFRDDDSGVGTQPLVRIASAPNNGWYTVHISHFAGTAVDTNFTLLYGRYSAGNPNCAPATTPLAVERSIEVDDALKLDRGVRAPRPGAPGSEE